MNILVYFYYYCFLAQVNPEDNSTAVIQSVVAVPVEDWSLDYIRPKSVCIKKDGECLQTTFPVAPESTKVKRYFS